jgi:hypothetical protein
MKQIGRVLGALAYAAISAAAHGAAAPAIHIEDVARFYEVYDAANGQPTAEQLQRDYLDAGSEGLHQFAKVRNITGIRIAETLAKRPEIYSSAKRCMVVLPRVRERVDAALRTLTRLYPQARLPRSRLPSAEASLSASAARSRDCRSVSKPCARPNGSIPMWKIAS